MLCLCKVAIHLLTSIDLAPHSLSLSQFIIVVSSRAKNLERRKTGGGGLLFWLERRLRSMRICMHVLPLSHSERVCLILVHCLFCGCLLLVYFRVLDGYCGMFCQ